ncbi:MAG: hypothetical protein IT385_07620 [Deltaproteobacteria bacterium]|nr:hypothetical protein [Deltaproteobacteria bacterium]
MERVTPSHSPGPVAGRERSTSADSRGRSRTSPGLDFGSQQAALDPGRQPGYDEQARALRPAPAEAAVEPADPAAAGRLVDAYHEDGDAERLVAAVEADPGAVMGERGGSLVLALLEVASSSAAALKPRAIEAWLAGLARRGNKPSKGDVATVAKGAIAIAEVDAGARALRALGAAAAALGDAATMLVHELLWSSVGRQRVGILMLEGSGGALTFTAHRALYNLSTGGGPLASMAQAILAKRPSIDARSPELEAALAEDGASLGGTLGQRDLAEDRKRTAAGGPWTDLVDARVAHALSQGIYTAGQDGDLTKARALFGRQVLPLIRKAADREVPPTAVWSQIATAFAVVRDSVDQLARIWRADDKAQVSRKDALVHELVAACDDVHAATAGIDTAPQRQFREAAGDTVATIVSAQFDDDEAGMSLEVTDRLVYRTNARNYERKKAREGAEKIARGDKRAPSQRSVDRMRAKGERATILDDDKVAGAAAQRVSKGRGGSWSRRESDLQRSLDKALGAAVQEKVRDQDKNPAIREAARYWDPRSVQEDLDESTRAWIGREAKKEGSTANTYFRFVELEGALALDRDKRTPAQASLVDMVEDACSPSSRAGLADRVGQQVADYGRLLAMDAGHFMRTEATAEIGESTLAHAAQKLYAEITAAPYVARLALDDDEAARTRLANDLSTLSLYNPSLAQDAATVVASRLALQGGGAALAKKIGPMEEKERRAGMDAVKQRVDAAVGFDLSKYLTDSVVTQGSAIVRAIESAREGAHGTNVEELQRFLPGIPSDRAQQLLGLSGAALETLSAAVTVLGLMANPPSSADDGKKLMSDLAAIANVLGSAKAPLELAMSLGVLLGAARAGQADDLLRGGGRLLKVAGLFEVLGPIGDTLMMCVSTVDLMEAIHKGDVAGQQIAVARMTVGAAGLILSVSALGGPVGLTVGLVAAGVTMLAELGISAWEASIERDKKLSFWRMRGVVA